MHLVCVGVDVIVSVTECQSLFEGDPRKINLN